MPKTVVVKVKRVVRKGWPEWRVWEVTEGGRAVNSFTFDRSEPANRYAEKQAKWLGIPVRRADGD